MQYPQKHHCESIFELESGLCETCARSLLKVSAEAQGEAIADSSQKDNAESNTKIL
ncbi:hypothetical protein [Helicobacter cinaedi]|uniref:hypothetical protein n=1 Tax=Helicobacter cinaedi TaxID=213 RepID=UPI0015F2948C|nr:hypothetical protein [Helicobacter cinaedi]